jgi:hypothetical protein
MRPNGGVSPSDLTVNSILPCMVKLELTLGG